MRTKGGKGALLSREPQGTLGRADKEMQRDSAEEAAIKDSRDACAGGVASPPLDGGCEGRSRRRFETTPERS